jgi:hypothetical protein
VDNPSPPTTNPNIAGPSVVPQNTPRETIIIRESAPAAEPAREGWVQLGFEHALGILVGLILCLLLLLSIFLILMRRLVDKSTLRAELSTIYGMMSRPVVISGEAAGPVLRSRTGGAGRPAPTATSAKPAARVAKTPELPKRNTKVVQYTDLSIKYDDLRETFDQERKDLEQEIKKEEAAIMERIIAENASMSAKMVGLSAA